jgi:hypothetical protein
MKALPLLAVGYRGDSRVNRQVKFELDFQSRPVGGSKDFSESVRVSDVDGGSCDAEAHFRLHSIELIAIHGWPIIVSDVASEN